MKSLSKNKVVIGVIGVVFLLLCLFLFRSVKSPSLNWSITQVGSDEVDVYLQGQVANKVSGFDLNIAFDNSTVHVESAEPGGFFQSPITVRSDGNILAYTLITNPLNKVDSDPTKPVFRFHLTPNSLKGYKFSVLPTSQVYVSNSGGMFPVVAETILK